MLKQYLEKHAYFPAQIERTPDEALGVVIVIPCFNEPDVERSVQSLLDCTPIDSSVEIIVVVNHSEKASVDIKSRNIATSKSLISYSESLEVMQFKLHVINAFDLPEKHAGVGLARKIGMDEAVRRFAYVDKQDGIICAFDADATCRDNYLIEVEQFFRNNPRKWAVSIYFEHPLDEMEADSPEYKAIYAYELHLRYQVGFLRYIDYPYAFHTVGSSMAVTAHGYSARGGMSKRKAGEDFYFLHKFSVIGRLGVLTSSTVFPSARSSDRVPFGTGRAIGQLLDSGKELETYDPIAFIALQHLFQYVEALGVDCLSTIKNEDSIAFLEGIGFEAKLKEIYKNTASKEAFISRFYQFFNPFIVMKWLHYYRDTSAPNIPVAVAAMNLAHLTGATNPPNLLTFFRSLDQKQ